MPIGSKSFNRYIKLEKSSFYFEKDRKYFPLKGHNDNKMKKDLQANGRHLGDAFHVKNYLKLASKKECFYTCK